MTQLPHEDQTHGRTDDPPQGWNGRTLLHVAVHRGWRGHGGNGLNLNAGDTCLNPLVRQFIDQAAGPFRWILKQIWEPITPDAMRALQDQVDGMVIGGGGLFLREQPGTDLSASGWTWNCPIAALNEIRKPVAVFAVGYNRFRGHDEFEPIFFDHINRLAELSGFFGLRNNGSILALRPYLSSPQLQEKLALQVCPTTLIWQLRPDMRTVAMNHDAKNKRVLAFNCAFDRADMRFGKDPDKVLGGMARAIGRAQGAGWQVQVVAHKTLDLQILPFLDEARVAYQVRDISNDEPDAIMRLYAETDLVIGLRGHAQMIPFGLRRPILSIISHDKMRFFLDDIGRPEWGVDVIEPAFEENLNAAIARISTAIPAVRNALADAQEKLWRQSEPNMRIIADVLGKNSQRPFSRSPQPVQGDAPAHSHR